MSDPLCAITALFDAAARARERQRIAVTQLGTVSIVERALELTQLDRALPRAKTRTEAIQTIEQLDGPAA